MDPVQGDPCRMCGRRKVLLRGLVWFCTHCIGPRLSGFLLALLVGWIRR